MSSQACSLRKERTCPADLKMKLTIEPMSPGRREPNFCPIVLSPFPTARVPALSPFIAARATALRTKPVARTTACSVQPYFLKIFLTLSRKGRASSLCWSSIYGVTQMRIFFSKNYRSLLASGPVFLKKQKSAI